MRDISYNQIIEVPIISGCFMLFNRKYLDDIGYFDKNMFIQYGAGSNSSLYLYANNNEIMRLTGTGVSFANSYWHGCINGNQRFYYAPNATTYLRNLYII
jgi:hypothetical protein